MPNLFEINIEGLSEVLKSLDSKTMENNIKLGIGLATRNLEDGIMQSVVKRYNISTVNFRRSLVSRPSSMLPEGVLAEIEFKYISTGLAAFSSPTMFEWGNIPPYPKQKQGKVYSVAVKRGNVKVSYGKYGFGGFMVKKGNKYVMLERTAAGRNAPLKAMYAPTITQMVKYVLNNFNSFPETYSAIENFAPTVVSKL